MGLSSDTNKPPMEGVLSRFRFVVMCARGAVDFPWMAADLELSPPQEEVGAEEESKLSELTKQSGCGILSYRGWVLSLQKPVVVALECTFWGRTRR